MSSSVTAASPESPKKDGSKMLKSLIAGAGSGTITKSCIAPLERAKILLQIQAMRGEAVLKYQGTWGTMSTVVADEGFWGLWRGNLANVLRVVPVYALKFSFNDKFKAMAGGGDGKPLTFSQLMMSGTLAGLFQSLATYPMEVVRTRLSVGEGLGLKYNGIVHCSRELVAKEGYLAFYKGIVPTLLSGAPYVGMQMSFYEVFKRFTPKSDSPTVSALYSLLPGTSAGVLAQTITYPGDTVRRRMQTDGAGGRPQQYSGLMDCCRQIARKEGIGGFFQGLRTNIIRCIPGAGIQFFAYEAILEALHAR